MAGKKKSSETAKRQITYPKYLEEGETPGPGASVGVWVDSRFKEPAIQKGVARKAIIAHYSEPTNQIYPNLRSILHFMSPEEFGLAPDSKKFEHWLHSKSLSYGLNILYSWFTKDELDIIEAKIWENRWVSFKRQATDLMQKLYEEGLEGNIQAIKEYLTRVLGAPSQQISLTHEAGDSLESLLANFSATQAYKRPRVDSEGNELVELVLDETTEDKHYVVKGKNDRRNKDLVGEQNNEVEEHEDREKES